LVEGVPAKYEEAATDDTRTTINTMTRVFFVAATLCFKT
jgi:hypothetical protein